MSFYSHPEKTNHVVPGRFVQRRYKQVIFKIFEKLDFLSTSMRKSNEEKIVNSFTWLSSTVTFRFSTAAFRTDTALL